MERGFGGNTKLLLNDQATKENVYSSLNEISQNSVPDSHFLFYFHGHGGAHGIYLGNNDRKIINPDELYKKMRNIRGKKSIIIDCCNAGYFLNEKYVKKIPENTLVIASCGENLQARETYNPFESRFTGKFISSLIKFLEKNNGKINLADLKIHLNERLSAQTLLHYQEPNLFGGPFTILAIKELDL